jgi:flagellin-like hook-associated protein FlgL
MDGISTYGTNNYNTQQILQTQKSMQETQQQVTSGKVSTNYAGIASSSQQTIQFENETTMLDNFATTNTVANLRLTSMSTSITAINTTITNFRNQLQDFANTGKTDLTSVNQMQQNAFNALKAMESYLNADVNGTYVFGGDKTETSPVDVGVQSFADFQSLYNGSTTEFPTSSAADTANVATKPADTGALTFNAANGTITSAKAGQLSSLPVGSIFTATDATGALGRYTVGSNDGTTIAVGPVMTTEPNPAGGPATAITITRAATATTAATTLPTSVSFTAPGTMTAAVAGSFTNMPVGSTFSISGANSYGNNGGWVVASNNGTTITIQRPTLPATVSATASLAVTSQFQGSDGNSPQQIDKNKVLDTPTTALDPAFEKAMRAMGMVAQGVFGTAGGLDQNLGRATDALYLTNDSLIHNSVGTPPFDKESPRSLQDVEFTVANQQKTLSDTTSAQANYLSFIQGTVDNTESADPTSTIMKLLNQQQSLQASYQALSKTRSLSLLDYLK